MIEKNINNLRNRFANVRMSEDDKRDVFKRISLVVDKIESVSMEHHKVPVVSPFANNFSNVFGKRFATDLFVYIRQRKFMPSLTIVLLLCVTGGFSAFAENALPGDSLYSLKVNVNEEVKGMVATTPEAKARYAVETTERRLQEAVILSSQGKLTDERKQILQGQLSKNANEVKSNVASLVASNNISAAQEVSINFEASLKTHELILESLSNSTSATSTCASSTATSTASSTIESTSTATVSPNTLMQDIRQEINYNAQVREDLSQKEIDQNSDPVNISAKLKDVKFKYSNLIYQKNNLTVLGYPSIKVLDNYLNTASTTIREAEKALDDKDYSKSISLLQQTVKAMSDSDSLISIELNGKPEIKKALELIDINKLISPEAIDPIIIDVATSTDLK